MFPIHDLMRKMSLLVTLPKHFQTVFFVCNKKKIVDFCFFEWFGIQKIFRTVCSSEKKIFWNTSTTTLPQNLWFFRMVKYSKWNHSCIWKNSTNFENGCVDLVSWYCLYYALWLWYYFNVHSFDIHTNHKLFSKY